MSATGTPAYSEGFGPLVPGVHFADFGDIASVTSLLSERTAAIIVEPVQGEGGVNPAPPGFLSELRRITRDNGSLLIFDEIQTGIGRTGPLFAYEAHDAVPDVMTLAKALGNGIPIGAMCTTERYSKTLVPGTHGSTFGGNPLAAACANAVLAELTDGGVLAHAQKVGAWLDQRMDALAANLGDKVVEVRGLGHLRAIELPGPAADTVARCREAGVLVIQAGPNNIRLAPPLVIAREELAGGLDIIESAIAG